MANTINATSGIGIVSTADNTNILNLQTNGANAITIDSSQNVSFANQLVLGVSGTTMQVRLSAAAETVTIGGGTLSPTTLSGTGTNSLAGLESKALSDYNVDQFGNETYSVGTEVPQQTGYQGLMNNSNPLVSETYTGSNPNWDYPENTTGLPETDWKDLRTQPGTTQGFAGTTYGVQPNMNKPFSLQTMFENIGKNRDNLPTVIS